MTMTMAGGVGGDPEPGTYIQYIYIYIYTDTLKKYDVLVMDGLKASGEARSPKSA